MGERRTVTLDKETYQTLRDISDRLKIGMSGVIRIIVQNDIPLSSLAQIAQKGKTEAVEKMKNKPITEETETREETKKEEKGDKHANRPVGRDHKRFFAERLGIPYPPDPEED